MSGPERATVTSDPELAPPIDTSVAHPARRYDYWLGGKDNFAADRASGDAVAAAFPTIRTAAIENRGFLRRAVKHLAEQAGIRQFLDIGAGIPTRPNTHEVAQAIDVAARVVYVDNDPVVLVHGRALLTSSTAGAAAFVGADVCDPDKILGDEQLRSTLDWSQPVALMLVAVLHFVGDDADPYGIVKRLVEAMPAGSYLVMSHATAEHFPPELVADIAAGRYGPFWPRSRERFARFFDGHELVPPGIRSVAEWRAEAEPQPRPTAADTAAYATVARIS